MWKIVWGSFLDSVLVGWMNPVINHVILMIALPVLSKISGWWSPHGRWEVELERAAWSSLAPAILQGSQPQWKMKSVWWHLVHCFYFLIPSYLAARQLMLSLLKRVTARERPLYTEDFKLASEKIVVWISMFWLLVRWQGLGGVRSDQLWLSCVMISQWVPAGW